MERAKVIGEISRIASELGVTSLTQKEFDRRGQIGLTTVRGTFGSWNRAVEAAGLRPNAPNGRAKRSNGRADEEYLREIIRLTEALGHKPTEAEMSAFGNFSVRPYRTRWGTFRSACDRAYERFGYPHLAEGNQ